MLTLESLYEMRRRRICYKKGNDFLWGGHLTKELVEQESFIIRLIALAANAYPIEDTFKPTCRQLSQEIKDEGRISYTGRDDIDTLVYHLIRIEFLNDYCYDKDLSIRHFNGDRDENDSIIEDFALGDRFTEMDTRSIATLYAVMDLGTKAACDEINSFVKNYSPDREAKAIEAAKRFVAIVENKAGIGISFAKLNNIKPISDRQFLIKNAWQVFYCAVMCPYGLSLNELYYIERGLTAIFFDGFSTIKMPE